MVRPLPPALPALLDVVVFGILPPSLKDKTSSYSAKAASNKVSDLAISGWRVPFPMVSPPFRSILVGFRLYNGYGASPKGSARELGK